LIVNGQWSPTRGGEIFGYSGLDGAPGAGKATPTKYEEENVKKYEVVSFLLIAGNTVPVESPSCCVVQDGSTTHQN
jgi:hypothetical protein